MTATLRQLNLALRGLMELGIIVALGYWGYQIGNNAGMKILLGVGVPLLVFGFWGLVDFHQTGSISELLRLSQELIISGVAALAWYAAGQQALGLALGFVSLVYHAMVYSLGGTLLKG